MYRNRKSQQGGFTLVELLVVIAVISILAGMLLPVLENVANQARGISCMNNLKQIGLGIMSYVEDNDGFMPCSLATNSASNYGSFYKQIDIYTGQRSTSYDNPDPCVLYQCPSDENFFPAYGYLSSYGGNINCFIYSSSTTSATLKRYNTITRPSKLRGILDLDDSFYTNPNLTTEWYFGGLFKTEPRHNDSVSAMYMDYHVGMEMTPFLPAKDEPFQWTRTGLRSN
jgi:prepilin-type N-terminal cleavage/methylation domain-containing protein